MVNHIIKNFLSNCPHSPGIYQMCDKEGKIIYIGKAKNLYNRLSSYLHKENYRVINFLPSINEIKIIITRNEAEAFLLEAQLIKKHKPKYNILLKDDKSFPYIIIKKAQQFPQIAKFRGKRNKNYYFYGPFPSSRSVDQMLILLQKAFLLRSCTDSFFNSRKRPCLLYQIKRCSAPCVNKISPELYAKNVDEAQKFLSGRSNELRREIVAEMEDLSDNLQYEQAALLRDRLKAIGIIQAKQFIEMPSIKDADIIAVCNDGDHYSLNIMFIRGGNNLGSKNYHPASVAGANKQEVVENFIGNFYQTAPPPNKILLNILLPEKAILEKVLYDLHEVKVNIEIPTKGNKKNLVGLAEINAQNALKNLVAKSKQYQDILLEMRNLFHLDQDINRIEIYDNSHISGKNAVGARIVWEEGEFNKKEYRLYNLVNSNPKGGDDYTMLRQVLLRRFKNRQGLDNLFIIDGGKGHATVVSQVMTELNINLDFICVSKGKERNSGNEVIYDKLGNEIILSKKSKLKQFIQVLRDEAHRFAIISHRRSRNKNLLSSELDLIPAIGPWRRKKLLEHFGSLDAIKGASMDELVRVESVSRGLAQVIYTHFHS